MGQNLLLTWIWECSCSIFSCCLSTIWKAKLSRKQERLQAQGWCAWGSLIQCQLPPVLRPRWGLVSMTYRNLTQTPSLRYLLSDLGLCVLVRVLQRTAIVHMSTSRVRDLHLINCRSVELTLYIPNTHQGSLEKDKFSFLSLPIQSYNGYEFRVLVIVTYPSREHK